MQTVTGVQKVFRLTSTGYLYRFFACFLSFIISGKNQVLLKTVAEEDLN